MALAMDSSNATVAAAPPPSFFSPPSGLEALQMALGLADACTTELGMQLLQQLAGTGCSAPASAHLPPAPLASGDEHTGGVSSASGDDEASGLQGAGGSGSLPVTSAAGGGGGTGSAARIGRVSRTPDQRLHATKEKNRKAQQRFRQRQKEKMAFLEEEVKRLGAENARLSALLHQRAAGTAAAVVTDAAATASGGSCGAAAQGPPSPTPLALGAAPATFAALAALLPHAAVPLLGSPVNAQDSDELLSSPQQLAAAPAAAACPDPAAGPPPLPPLEEQHEGLGRLLEGLPGLDVATADTYMQAWLQMPDTARACHLRTLARRVAAGRASDAVCWVQTAARQAVAPPLGASAAATAAATVNTSLQPAPLAQPAAAQA